MSRTISHRKLTFVIDTNAIGGTERYLADLCREMSERYELTLICPPFKELDSWIDNFKNHDITVKRIRIRHIFDLPNFIRLYIELKKSDIVHFVLPCPARLRLGIILSWLSQVRLRIATIQLVTPPNSKHALRNHFTQKSIKFAYSKLNRIVAVSRENKRQLQDIFKIQHPAIKVIYNSIDIHLYKKKAGEKYDFLPKDKTCIALIGRLHPQKGHEILINAAPRIIKNCPECHFLFLGDGDLKSCLREKIRRKGLERYFTFAGNCPDIHTLLPSLDIVVLPSLFEGFPFVLLEAMAASLPVVASDVGGNAEAVTDGITGFLVRPRDSAHLSDRILFLLNNKILAQKMGKMAQERVAQKFNLQKMV
ncbi:glycosyltransferase, partial [candidate division KSB1 bacterium]|nr:glycosyltransferase [candidate division KSB1 bacterium]